MKLDIKDLKLSKARLFCELYNFHNFDNTGPERTIYFNNIVYKYKKRDLFLVNPKTYKEDIIKKIKLNKFKGKSIEEWKALKIEKLRHILEILQSKSYSENEIGSTSGFKYNKEIDRKYAIDELVKLIDFIKDIEFNTNDSTSECICKIHLILDTTNGKAFIKNINARMSNVKNLESDKKENKYIFNGYKPIFYPFISVEYGQDCFGDSITYEFSKNTNLGIYSNMIRTRIKYSYNRANNWISYKTIMDRFEN